MVKSPVAPVFPFAARNPRDPQRSLLRVPILTCFSRPSWHSLRTSPITALRYASPPTDWRAFPAGSTTFLPSISYTASIFSSGKESTSLCARDLCILNSFSRGVSVREPSSFMCIFSRTETGRDSANRAAAAPHFASDEIFAFHSSTRRNGAEMLIAFTCFHAAFVVLVMRERL